MIIYSTVKHQAAPCRNTHELHSGSRSDIGRSLCTTS